MLSPVYKYIKYMFICTIGCTDNQYLKYIFNPGLSMRLTSFTDYSLRVLIYAASYPDRLVTITELAEVYGISRNHLMKIVHHLAQRGYIETVRGKGGGLRLAKSPQSLSVGELVRSCESGDTLVECFSEQSNQCRIQPACRLQGIFRDALQGFYRVLDDYTLADLLAQDQAQLLQLLDEPATPQ